MSEATWSCTDGSYQIATTVLVQPDTSDPSVTVAFSPAAPDGNGDWYTTLPTAAFTCTDDGSGVAACPETLRAATDGGWTPTGTVTDGVGNSAVVTGPTIKIDTTPPAVTTQITGTLGENGWYTSTPVSVLRTCTDPVAGDGSHSDMATCPPNRYASDGVFTVPADQATDRAGNTTDVDQVVVKVDSVGPVIEFTKNVDTFTFTCTDKAPAYDRAPASGNALGYGKMRDIQTSGVATCPDPVTLSPTDPTATVKATDNAGNATEMAISVPSDTAGPTVITTIVGAANRAGWYHGPVRLSFTCTDTVSGMTGGQASCPADVTLTRDGRNLTVEVTAVDKAGNETTVRIPGISIDATAPTAALTGVRTGQSVTAGTRPARCAGADALSGVASCTLLVTGPTNGIGWVTVRALATDRAGNTTTSAPVRYQVTPKVTVSWTAGTLRVGHSYVFTVRLTDAAGHLVSGIVPRYLWPTKLTATGAGRTPYLDGGTLLRVSPGVYRVRVTLSPRMIAAPYWTFAISVAGVTSPRVYRVTR
jgi:hypothetical protein